MNITIDNTEYYVHFEYNLDHTMCAFGEAEEKITWIGSAYKHPSDVYRKPLGRAKALNRACRLANLPRDLKKKIFTSLRQKGMKLGSHK